MIGLIDNGKLERYIKNPKELEKYHIFFEGSTGLTHNEEEIMKSVKENRIFPSSALYTGKKWVLLERGTKDYHHGNNQRELVSSDEVQKNLSKYTSGCSPIIWGPGYFGKSEISTLLKAKEMNPKFNLKNIVVIEGSKESAINFSVNLASSIFNQTGKLPTRIDTYARLYEESPDFFQEARSRLPSPNAVHLVFGSINDFVNVIEPHDSKMLYMLSKVAKTTDLILRSTHEFEKLTDYEKKIKIREGYDTEPWWDFVTEVPEKMGIKTKGKGIGRHWEFDNGLMAGVHSIQSERDGPLTLLYSEKCTYGFELKKVERSGLYEKFHVKDKNSSATVWGLRPRGDLTLSSKGLEELIISCREYIKENPNLYGVSNGDEKLEVGYLKKLIQDKMVGLREDKRKEKSGFPEKYKKLRTLFETLECSGDSLEKLITKSNLRPETKDALEIISNFREPLGREDIYELKETGRIIVAEDDEITGISIKGILENYGFEVELVSDGEEALRLYQGGNFDEIILDVELPGRSGIEIGTEIRRENKDIPIFIMSGHGRDEYPFEAGQMANYFLSKPITSINFKRLKKESAKLIGEYREKKKSLEESVE